MGFAVLLFMSVTVVYECGESFVASSRTVDLVFFNGTAASSNISPWSTQTKHKWMKEWLPQELDRCDGDPVSFRIFSAVYRNIKTWGEQFPLLETSKQFLHAFKKKQIGKPSHSTIFFAWGFDSLVLKQIIYLSCIDNNTVRKHLAIVLCADFLLSDLL